MHSLLDALVRNYEMTDPAKGLDSEPGKTEIARQSIELWWMLFDELVAWAQDHLAGRIWCKANLEFANELASVWGIAKLDEDSHFFERIGKDYGSSSETGDDPLFFYLLKKEESAGEDFLTDLGTPELRLAMREFLRAEAGRRSRYWRESLADALFALNHGIQSEPLVPVKSRTRGEFFESLTWKCEAVCRVLIMVGQGKKKHIALSEIADALAQSTETLRSWEKLLQEIEEYSARLHAARLAGAFKKELETRTVESLEDEYGVDGFGNRSFWFLAHRELKRAENISLERIRSELDMVRRSKRKSVVPKKRI